MFSLDLFLDDLKLKLNKTNFEDFSVDARFENFLNILFFFVIDLRRVLFSQGLTFNFFSFLAHFLRGA